VAYCATRSFGMQERRPCLESRWKGSQALGSWEQDFPTSLKPGTRPAFWVGNGLRGYGAPPDPDSVSPGLLGRISRPSVARAAWSRGRLPESLRPRCSREQRPPSKPEEPFRYALPVECPVAPLCGMRRGSGWLIQHNGVPGTSRWGVCPSCPGAVSATVSAFFIAIPLRCYKVRSLSSSVRKPCDIFEKYFNLRELHGEDYPCFRLG